MPNYAVNCTTESAIYVIELWVYNDFFAERMFYNRADRFNFRFTL